MTDSTPPPIDIKQAEQFLRLLGKTPANTRLRGFLHRDNPRKFNPKTNPQGDRGSKGGWGPAVSQAIRGWQAIGRGIYAVINDAGSSGADTDDQTTTCRAFWIEWDNRVISWQLIAWKQFGLGEPSIIVVTGGKSAHLYWVLSEPIAVDRWRRIQAALIALTGADPANKNPSRVMRLPGAWYMDANGQPTNQTTIHSSSDRRYAVEDVEAWVAALSTTTPTAAHAAAAPVRAATAAFSDLPPRPPEALREALLRIPPFQHGAGQYLQLLGLALRLHVELGAAAAEQLLAETCCGAINDLPSYFGRLPTEISPGSVWPYLRDTWGVDISRHDLRGKPDAQRHQEAGPHQSASIAAVEHPQEPAPQLTLAAVREQLRTSIEAGVSRSDLEALRLELAGQADIPAASLLGLVRSIEAEHEASLTIAAEVRTIREAGEQREVAAGLTLDYLLPPSLAAALRVRTTYLPSDDLSALMAYLVTCSGVVKLGTEVVASHAADYRVPLNIYGCLVARSGAKKSPLSKLLVEQPTHELQLDLARHHSRAMAEWVDQNRGIKPSDRPDPPQAGYLSVSDATAEALAQQLQVQEGQGLGLLLHRDELAGLFGSLNAYRGGRGSDSEQLLEAYDGGGFRSLRIATTGGGRFYARCHLSIWGTIQPDVLKALVADGDAAGLWARFLFVPLPERVVALPAHESDHEQQASAAAKAYLADICGLIYRMPRTSLALSPDGRAAFMAYEAQCQGLALAATIAAQGALFGKSAGKCLRLAALIHLLHQVTADGEHSATIGAEAIHRAATLTDHLNAWTLSLHAEVAGGGANDLMRQIHRIATAAAGPVSWRDISQRLSKAQRGQIDSAAATQAMQALAELGAGEISLSSRGTASYRATQALA